MDDVIRANRGRVRAPARPEPLICHSGPVPGVLGDRGVQRCAFGVTLAMRNSLTYSFRWSRESPETLEGVPGQFRVWRFYVEYSTGGRTMGR